MNELVGRIRAEFLEMPGLRLTVAQASRLWGLDEGACRHVIDVLVGSSFLRWTRRRHAGAGQRMTAGPSEPLDLQEVGVSPGEVRVDADEHHGRTARQQAAGRPVPGR